MSTNETLLSYDSIQKIRQYVMQKFSHLPKEKHADIVADAIVKVVNDHLPSFQYETKKKITGQIIKQVVVERKGPLSINDIAKIVDQHPLSETDKEIYKHWRQLFHTSLISEDEMDSTAGSFVSEENTMVTSQEVAAASIEQTTMKPSISWLSKKRTSTIFAVAFVVLFGSIVILNNISINADQQSSEVDMNNVAAINADELALSNLPANELPSHLQFVSFDKDKIKSYLKTRNSLLVDEPYFSAIYNTALDFNIHPVLLFAITGQEQGFVNREHERADEIVQNPFNVFHSWQDYNTNIEDSTAIAARTIVNLSKDRPAHIDAVQWINRKYAEDENWHLGVNALFNTIINYEAIE